MLSLERVEKMKIRCMCEVTRKDKKQYEELRPRLGLRDDEV